MGAKDPGAPDWSELEVFQRLSEITNINFEFEVSETGTWPEQKNIALVGGEYGDIILRDKSATDANMAVTDEETYGPQGIFLDLTDLIDQYAPNIKAMMEKYPDVKASMLVMAALTSGTPISDIRFRIRDKVMLLKFIAGTSNKITITNR